MMFNHHKLFFTLASFLAATSYSVSADTSHAANPNKSEDTPLNNIETEHQASDGNKKLRKADIEAIEVYAQKRLQNSCPRHNQLLPIFSY